MPPWVSVFSRQEFTPFSKVNETFCCDLLTRMFMCSPYSACLYEFISPAEQTACQQLLPDLRLQLNKKHIVYNVQANKHFGLEFTVLHHFTARVGLLAKYLTNGFT